MAFMAYGMVKVWKCSTCQSFCANSTLQEALPTVFTGCAKRTTHANTSRRLLPYQLWRPWIAFLHFLVSMACYEKMMRIEDELLSVHGTSKSTVCPQMAGICGEGGSPRGQTSIQARINDRTSCAHFERRNILIHLLYTYLNKTQTHIHIYKYIIY